MKRKHITFGIALVVLGVCISYYIISNRTMIHSRVVIDGTSFAVKVADSDSERMKGLGGTTFLDSREGMLFMFSDPGNYKFWMKDMQMIIDIVWIDSNWRIMHIEHSVSPESYPNVFGPDADSQYVLEVQAGVAKEVNMQVGDEVKFVTSK